MSKVFQRNCHIPHKFSGLIKLPRGPRFDIKQDFPWDELHNTNDVRHLTVTDALIHECSQLSVPIGG